MCHMYEILVLNAQFDTLLEEHGTIHIALKSQYIVCLKIASIVVPTFASLAYSCYLHG